MLNVKTRLLALLVAVCLGYGDYNLFSWAMSVLTTPLSSTTGLNVILALIGMGVGAVIALIILVCVFLSIFGE